jgi:hypothetical protein
VHVSACANDWGIPLNQHRENIGIFIHAFLIFLLWGHIVIWGTAFIRAARSFSSSTVVTISIPSSPCNCFLHLYNYKLTYTILLFTVSLHLYSYYHPSNWSDLPDLKQPPHYQTLFSLTINYGESYYSTRRSDG